MKKFTRKVLQNQLGATEQEVQIVMDYQKNFPILCEVEEEYTDEMFIVSARDIHEQVVLNAKSKDIKGTEFARWIKRRIDKMKLVENVDYSTFVKFDFRENTNLKSKSKEYKVTMDVAKHLCMMENNEKGFIARRYFILMEKFIKRKLDWEDKRTLAKRDYKPLCSEFIRYLKEVLNINTELKNYYPYIADAVNVVAIGKLAKEVKDELDLLDNETRDNLEMEYNKRLDTAQRAFMSAFKLDVDSSKVWDYVFGEVEFRHSIDNKNSLNKMDKYNYLFM